MTVARVLLVLVAGCGRLDFATTDAGPGDATDALSGLDCSALRFAATPNTGETEIAITAMPGGYIVAWVPRAEGPLRLQRLDTLWQPIDQTPFAVPLDSARIASTFTDRYLLAIQDEGAATSTVFADDPGAPNLDLKGGAILTDPPGEKGFVLRAADVVMFSPDQGGNAMWTMSSDGTGAANAGGGGAGGDTVTDCVSDTDDTTTVTACVMTTLANCPLSFVTNATLGGSYTSILQRCPNPSVVQHTGDTYVLFDDMGGLDIASNRGPSDVNHAVPLLAPGDHGVIVADDRGLTLAYRDGAAIETAGIGLINLELTRSSSVVDGLPAALGMTLVPLGARTMLVVAAADGMYRACI